MLNAPRIFLAIALLLGFAFVAATPPFHAPDEPAHFYRAFAISEGKLSADVRPGRTGTDLPVSLGQLVDLFADSIALPPPNTESPPPPPPLDPAVLPAARQIVLEPEVRTFIDFPTTAVTTPLTYLPQAAAIAAGRFFGAPPLTLLYLARLANLLAAVGLIWVALRQLPAYRWLGVAIALTPMATFLRSSASADTLTFAIAFLFAAVVARLAFGDQETIRRRDVAWLCLLGAAVCLTKAAYLPLVAAAAVIPLRRLPRGRRWPAVFAYATAIGCAFALATLTARAVKTPFRPDVVIETDRQIASSVRQPSRFFKVATNSYLWYGPSYVEGFVGRLGWLNVPLPRLLLISYLVLLSALLVVDTQRAIAVASWQRAILAIAALTNVVLISAIFYAIFMPVGANHIAGIQGRYFLPIAPVAAWMFHSHRGSGVISRRHLGTAVGLFCTLALVISLTVLLRSSYG